ncbi:MAG: HEPN domain-containing protein [Gemmataceae bacterium]
MNPLTAEWVAKAEADYQGVVALNRHRKNPLPDLICFLCQQSAEKYLKAFLQEKAVPFPKTHILTYLLRLAGSTLPGVTKLEPSLIILEDYAVKFRYPGMAATTDQAGSAVAALRLVRRQLRKALGLTQRKLRRKDNP